MSKSSFESKRDDIRNALDEQEVREALLHGGAESDSVGDDTAMTG